MNELETLESVAITPFAMALACLADADVHFALLRDEPQSLDTARDLDVLVDAADRHLVFAALGRAGFVRKHARRLHRKWVFVRWVEDRFVVVDVHAAFVQNGITYMDTKLALSRLDRTGPVPRLGVEDRFLHIVLHNLLGKPALQPKHVPVLRALLRGGIDRHRLREQACRFGLEAIADEACDAFEKLVNDPQAWARLRASARRTLMRRPGSWLGSWRYRYGDLWRPRLDRRPVVVALLGPDGSGKTSFADALQRALHDTPLHCGRVYMGCWGHDLLPMRYARRLVPPQVSHTRVLAARLGFETALAGEERQRLQQRSNVVGLVAAALRYALKGAAFHFFLACELAYRYLRCVRLSRRSIVVSDRWVHDLEFRQGKVPFVHGQGVRALFYRLFPAPDGIIYLETSYDLVARWKPQLDRSQFGTMDRVFRTVLQPQRPLMLTSDAPPEALVRRFLTQHWETLLERCNRRA